MTKPKLKLVKKSVELPDGFYKIVNGIAIPAKIRQSYIETRYSFLKTLPVNKTRCIQIKDKKIYHSILNCAHNYGKKAGKTFVGRYLPEGYGIWRVK